MPPMKIDHCRPPPCDDLFGALDLVNYRFSNGSHPPHDGSPAALIHRMTAPPAALLLWSTLEVFIGNSSLWQHR
jgi:hypothetical protein